MRILLGLIFGFMIGFPYGIYYTVQGEDSGFSKLVVFIAKLKGLLAE